MHRLKLLIIYNRYTRVGNGTEFTRELDNIEVVPDFTHLGSKVNRTNDGEIRQRIMKVTEALYALHTVLTEKHQVAICKVPTRSVVT